MIEPFSLSTFLLTLGIQGVVNSIVQSASESASLPGTIDKIIGGLIGNNTNDAIGYGMKKVWQRMHQGGPDVNQDLQKSVRKAYLMATLGLCEGFLQQSGVASQFLRRDLRDLRREDVKWVDRLRDRLRKELKQLPKSQYIPLSTGAEKQVELFLAQPDNPEIIYQFRAQVQQNLIQYLSQNLGEPPDLFLHLIEDGWEIRQKGEIHRRHWFELLSAFFAEELKTNDRLRAIFSGQLLADLKINGVSVTVDSIETALDGLSLELSDRLIEISEKFGEVSGQIEALLPALTANSETWHTAIQDQLNRIEQQSNRRTLAEKYAGIAVAERVEQIARDYTQRFVGRESEFAEIDRQLRENHSQTVLVTTEAGYGKSALLANWRELRQGDGCFIAYHCFNYREDETRSLLNGYRNLLRQFYLYYELANEPLPSDLMRLQDILCGLLRERGGKPTEPLIIILDGLDEADRPVEGVFLDNLPENILIVASVRATPDELPDYLPRWAKKAQRLHLHRLDPAGIPQWVKQAGEGELAPYATNSGFIQELDETTAGFPLYLQYLLDELVQKARTGEDIAPILHRSPLGFSEYVKEQFRQLAQEDCIRQQTELKELFAIISVALGGLSLDDIQALTGLTEWDFPNLPWQITRWFTVQGETYSFTHPQLAREFQTFLGKQAQQAQQKLIDYCAQWQQYLSPYALRYYAAHLSAIKNWQGLYLLVRNQEFRRVQRQELPEEAMNLVLQTLQLALQGSAETDDAGAMAEFLLLHSRRREEILHESPLQALRNGSIIKAWQLADLYYDIDIQRCILWYLLLAWELKDEGRLKDAKETLQKLHQKNFSRLLMAPDWQRDYAAYLLTCVFDVSSDIAEALYPNLFEDDYWKHLLVIYLINAGEFTRAIEVARQINSVLEQIVTLETIATAQQESKDLEGAKATLATALQVADKIFPDSRWVYSIIRIAKLQIETGDERAKKDTLRKARKKMIAIKNIRNRTHLSVLMANLFSSIGEVKAALKILEEIEGKDKINDSSISMLIAEVQLQCRETEKAKNTYGQAKAIARNKEDSRECYAALVNIVQSQALMKDWDAAFETSEEIKIEQEWYYSEALFRIARKQLQEESWNLEEKIHRAILTIDKINCEEWKAPALQMLVESQAIANKFDDALKSAKSISRSLGQSLAFSTIAIQQAKAGQFEEAFNTIEYIERQYKQDGLIGIAKAYAQTEQFDLAIQIALMLDSPLRQVETLGAIAKIQVQFSQNKDARDTLARGLTISPSLDPSYLKAFALMQIAEEQVKSGDKDQGFITVNSAYDTAPKITALRQQIDVKIEIAEIYKKLEKLDKAKDILEKMRQSTDEIGLEQSHIRCNFFYKIAISQARIGEIGQSFETIHQIHIFDLQIKALKAISQIPFGVTQKRIVKERLDAVIENIHNLFLWNEVQVKTNIAVAKIALGETQTGLEIFAELCEQAQEYKNCSQILFHVAAAQAEAGEIDLALATVETIEDDFEIVKALKTIASFQWKKGDKDGIEKTLATALQAQERIQNKGKQLEAMSMISQIQVEAGKGEEAVETLNRLGKDRNHLIAVIASLMATVNDRKNFKQLLVPAALSLETAYPMCGYLAQLYPEQAAAVAEQFERTEVSSR